MLVVAVAAALILLSLADSTPPQRLAWRRRDTGRVLACGASGSSESVTVAQMFLTSRRVERIGKGGGVWFSDCSSPETELLVGRGAVVARS